LYWGCSVIYNKKYRRNKKNTPYGKRWVQVTFRDVREGIFLGHRTLFESKKSFRAALVSPSLLCNPVYVPLDSIQSI
jgi:hypothetical protein